MRVFVYGTLTEPEQARTVDPAATFAGSAILVGADCATGRYPTLIPGDGPVEGRLLDADIDAVDAYESVDRGLYARVSVPVAGGDTVETYVGDPERLGVDASWPGEGSLAERASEYLYDHAVVQLS